MTTKQTSKKTNGKAKVEKTTKAKSKDIINIKAPEVELTEKTEEIITFKAPEVELTSKIIPRDTWSAFKKWWNNTEWRDLTNADIENHLDNKKYLFVEIPANVINEKIGQAWFNEMKTFAEKGKASTSLKYRLNFANDETSIRDLLGLEDLKISDAMAKFRAYIGKQCVPLL